MANSEMDYIHGYMADQTYDPTSMNAQSGIAVAEALLSKIEFQNNIEKIYFNMKSSSGTLEMYFLFTDDFLSSHKTHVDRVQFATSQIVIQVATWNGSEWTITDKSVALS